MTYYMHDIPGRLRVRIPQLRKDPALAKTLQGIAGSIMGVKNIDLNPLTGSMVLYYDKHVVSSNHILNTLTRHGYFERSKAMTNEEYIKSKVSGAARVVGKALGGAFMDAALEGSALSFLAVLI
jgi:hypothetical protein